MSDDDVPGRIVEPTAQDEIRNKLKQPEAPSDFETVHTFLTYATKLFQDSLDYDKENRKQATDDAQFMVGEQWDDVVKQSRVAAKKPTLTFNRLPAFVAQLVGNRLLNETDIKITPDDDEFKENAKVRESLVRNIQKVSKAKLAYDSAFMNQVISGIGNWEVRLDYASDDVFEQDICIKAIHNAFAVVWDQSSEEATGEDAKYVFVVETMTRQDFKDEWPNGTAGDLSTDLRAVGAHLDTAWVTDRDIRVVRMWRMRTRKRIVALLTQADNENVQEVEDVTDMDLADFEDRLVEDRNGIPVMREVDRKYAELYTFTSVDLLEGPYELPIRRVPVFRVPGWDVNVGEKRVRFGLIRFMKDPQRLHNYWRSTIAEKLMQSPKAVWTASEDAIRGREKEWRESHLSNDSLLVWNSESGQEPKRVDPAQLEVALIQEANMASQDLRDISNLHEASLGQKSNEVSGKAILARQRVGETGTVIYQDNLELAIEATGRVVNDLIPFAYDTLRTIKILGLEDEEVTSVTINAVTEEDGLDITAGKYTVSSTTGPTSVTKRVEAVDGMLNMVNAMPDTMSVVADLIVQAQDWPGADKIAKRLQQGLPPGMVSEKDMSEEQKAAAKASQEAAQAEQQKQDVILKVELELKMAQAQKAVADAAKSQAEAIEAQANAALAVAKIDIEEFKAVASVETEDFNAVVKAFEAYQKTTQLTE